VSTGQPRYGAGVKPPAPTPTDEVKARAALALGVAGVAATNAVFAWASDRWTAVAAAMATAVAATLPFAAVRRRLRPTARDLALGLGAGALLFGAARALLWAVFTVWPALAARVGALYVLKGAHDASFLWATLVLVVVPGEELLWRGIITRALADRFGRAAGVAGGALLYALAHAAAPNPVLPVAALACGVVWGALYAWTDRLWPPILCHLVFDAAFLFVLPLPAAAAPLAGAATG
jgi:hypothetical protein